MIKKEQLHNIVVMSGMVINIIVILAILYFFL